MLIVALGIVAAAVFLFGAGFAIGCAMTHAVRDDDVRQAIEYEHSRLRNQWEKTRREAALVLQAWRKVNRYASSPTHSAATKTTTTTTGR